MTERKTMLVQKISDGTVIDHVSAGKSLSVLRLLGNPQNRGVTVALVMNVGSSKMGRKDILKVEGVELTDEQVQKLALIAPRASVVIIRSYRVAEKKNAVPPTAVVGILSCTGATCISVREKDSVSSIFSLVNSSPLAYRCKFCGRVLAEQEISAQLG
ncbi:MAG: aspartate carbamoyltransferase regulatory subunit [Thaumarchaeota archaeon]|nr:aspartate carbamoyltransferase regulatory subunit [Nitrososphaerota archaeon]